MRKQTICICQNKGADQLCGNHEADQRLCFRFMDTTIPLLSKSENFQPPAIFWDCTARFVSDPFGNHIVSFLITWLQYHREVRELPSNVDKLIFRVSGQVRQTFGCTVD